MCLYKVLFYFGDEEWTFQQVEARSNQVGRSRTAVSSELLYLRKSRHTILHTHSVLSRLPTISLPVATAGATWWGCSWRPGRSSSAPG